ncbi:MAG: hypothetical protein JNM17_08490 [Archangium sp.]|nr:hypothetical protein [Archangium sp.]
MQTVSDTQTSLTPNPDELFFRSRDFLSVSTFLKPKLRIAVGPRSGELGVQVEAVKATPAPRGN